MLTNPRGVPQAGSEGWQAGGAGMAPIRTARGASSGSSSGGLTNSRSRASARVSPTTKRIVDDLLGEVQPFSNKKGCTCYHVMCYVM